MRPLACDFGPLCGALRLEILPLGQPGMLERTIDLQRLPLRQAPGGAVDRLRDRALRVLKDIWDSDDREVEEIARWMLDALVDAALREVSGTSGRLSKKAS